MNNDEKIINAILSYREFQAKLYQARRHVDDLEASVKKSNEVLAKVVHNVVGMRGVVYNGYRYRVVKADKGVELRIEECADHFLTSQVKQGAIDANSKEAESQETAEG